MVVRFLTFFLRFFSKSKNTISYVFELLYTFSRILTGVVLEEHVPAIVT